MLEDFSSVSSSSKPSNLTAAAGTLFFTAAGRGRAERTLDVERYQPGDHSRERLGHQAEFLRVLVRTQLHLRLQLWLRLHLQLQPIGALWASAAISFSPRMTALTVPSFGRTDVATGSTQLVEDINPGPAGSDPHDFVDFSNSLYFTAHDGSTSEQNQLWKSNGTSAGTGLVASFSPAVTAGAAGLGGSSTSDIGTLGNDLFGPLNDGVHGTALWVTDGTAAGTTLLAQVDPQSFASLNGTEYFLATGSSSQMGSGRPTAR